MSTSNSPYSGATISTSLALSEELAEELLAQVAASHPRIACGILYGTEPNRITHLVPIKNIAPDPTTHWQLDPRQLTSTLTKLLEQKRIWQGIYCTNGTERAPSPATVARWRHHVACFLVSDIDTEQPQVRAFSINPLLRKVYALPLQIHGVGGNGEESWVPVDVVLGTDTETAEAVVLSPTTRKLSTYVIGTMGMGKTTLLLNIICFDIHNREGVCVIDPHGDLTKDILARIPQRREKDVILWEPFDREAPFGLNLFECRDVANPNLVDLVCSQALDTFYKLFHESWGPQMEDLLRVTFLTLIFNQDLPKAQRPTMAEIPRLLNDADYRGFLVSRIANQAVREFWQYTYNPLKPHEQVEYHRSSLNKVRRFLLNQTIRNIIGQAESSFDLRTVMDEGKILLVDLSKGELGEDNSALLGSILVGKLLTATLSRANVPFAQRRPFHLVVDEYQNFATTTFDTLQTEARKFAVDIIVAHQTRTMLDLESRGASLSVGNMVYFATTSLDAPELAAALDNTPPEPPVIGQQAIKTYSPAPWDHLVRSGHRNEDAHAILSVLRAALVPVTKPATSIRDSRRFIDEEDVRSFEKYLNSFLHQRMHGVPREDLLEHLRALWQAGPYYWFPEHEYKALEDGQSHTLVTRKSDVEVLLGKTPQQSSAWWESPYPHVVFSGESGRYFKEYQSHAQEVFYHLLDRLGDLLADDPIFTDSGQLEPIYAQPRLYSDVTAQTANTLANLNRHVAKCRLFQDDGRRVEHTIKTLPPPAIPNDAPARVQAIRDRSRRLYGRNRAAVEQAIAQRVQVPPPTRPAPSSERKAKPDSRDFWDKDT